MTFEQSLREVTATRRALAAAIEAEGAVWRDATYRRVRERHLDHLVNVLERFEADLEATSAAVAKAMRRLDQRP